MGAGSPVKRWSHLHKILYRLPDEPKLYFRIISIVLIGVTACALLLPVIRREIIRRFRQERLSVWDIVLLVLYFVIVDTIEHHRLFAFLFVYDTARTDLLEELFELPFMFSLFAVAFLLQRNDKQAGAKTLPVSRSVLHDVRN